MLKFETIAQNNCLCFVVRYIEISLLETPVTLIKLR